MREQTTAQGGTRMARRAGHGMREAEVRSRRRQRASPARTACQEQQQTGPEAGTQLPAPPCPCRPRAAVHVVPAPPTSSPRHPHRPRAFDAIPTASTPPSRSRRHPRGIHAALALPTPSPRRPRRPGALDAIPSLSTVSPNAVPAALALSTPSPRSRRPPRSIPVTSVPPTASPPSARCHGPPALSMSSPRRPRRLRAAHSIPAPSRTFRDTAMPMPCRIVPALSVAETASPVVNPVPPRSTTAAVPWYLPLSPRPVHTPDPVIPVPPSPATTSSSMSSRSSLKHLRDEEPAAEPWPRNRMRQESPPVASGWGTFTAEDAANAWASSSPADDWHQPPASKGKGKQKATATAWEDIEIDDSPWSEMEKALEASRNEPARPTREDEGPSNSRPRPMHHKKA
ncbi:hypothetical protein PLICRDRAFT_181195, partial [Plicaturopsis crispa FD-325 SS-3]